ncbi:hypothetical protein C8R45DRAFT_926647 [Mycena sanguinolenta]|nr:hypothetical protein C8R45DRAFT_926647 [Mycena sanguinolenta]
MAQRKKSHRILYYVLRSALPAIASNQLTLYSAQDAPGNTFTLTTAAECECSTQAGSAAWTAETRRHVACAPKRERRYSDPGCRVRGCNKNKSMPRCGGYKGARMREMNEVLEPRDVPSRQFTLRVLGSGEDGMAVVPATLISPHLTSESQSAQPVQAQDPLKNEYINYLSPFCTATMHRPRRMRDYAASSPRSETKALEIAGSTQAVQNPMIPTKAAPQFTPDCRAKSQELISLSHASKSGLVVSWSPWCGPEKKKHCWAPHTICLLASPPVVLRAPPTTPPSPAPQDARLSRSISTSLRPAPSVLLHQRCPHLQLNAHTAHPNGTTKASRPHLPSTPALQHFIRSVVVSNSHNAGAGGGVVSLTLHVGASGSAFTGFQASASAVSMGVASRWGYQRRRERIRRKWGNERERGEYERRLCGNGSLCALAVCPLCNLSRCSVTGENINYDLQLFALHPEPPRRSRAPMKKKEKKNANEAARQYVRYEGVLAWIDSMEPTTLGTAKLVSEVNNVNPALNKLETIVRFAVSNTEPDTAAKATWCRLRDRIAEAKKLQRASCGIPSHRKKRKLIHDLKFEPRPRPLADFITNQPHAREDSSFERPHIVYRERTTEKLKQRKCGQHIIIDEEEDYYDVEEDESVLFLHPGDDHIELAVLRGIAQGTPYSDALYDFLEAVIQAACAEHRNVRVGGLQNFVFAVVEISGYSLLTLEKCYIRLLDRLTGVAHDEDVIAALTLLWSIAKSLLPIELIDSITNAVGDIGLPKITTRNVAEGTGYKISLAGKTYEFPLYDRAPPTHIDPSHAPYSLSWTVRRTAPPPRSSEPEPASQWSSSPSYRVLHSQSAASTSATTARPAEVPAPCPEHGGGNFIDRSLKVRVKQAAGILLAHCSDYMHGSTRLCGASACGLTIPFSQHVKQEFEKTKAKDAIDTK